jgi:precorrin-6Y C5,15-methyltransferase (decarboxylating)
MEEIMSQILLFGGTTEGRILTEYLSSKHIHTYVCVATDYGEKLLLENQYITVKAKRLTEEEIVILLEQYEFDMVIDATHPFAVVVSGNIKRACEKKRVEYIRILREEDVRASFGIWVNTIEEAVDYLQNTNGNILITTGSNELKAFTKLEHFALRCYPRVLSSMSVMEKSINLGFLESHLMCMQGPFIKDLNVAILRQMNASYLVTKESGSTGGFEDKILAAKETNVVPIIIGRPKELSGLTILQVKELLNQRYPMEENTKITLLGIGMGNKNTLTLEGIEALKHCQLIIGSDRILHSLREFNKDAYATTKNEEIIQYIKEHKEYKNIVVAFSGDIGFYSGAKRLRPYLSEYEVSSVSGISSPIYFLGKLGVPWEDVTFLSLHGRTGNLIDTVKNNTKVFTLLGGENSVNKICEELIEHNLDVSLYVGENLSYDTEKITIGTPQELVDKKFDIMSVLFIENTGLSPSDINQDEIKQVNEIAYNVNLDTHCYNREVSLHQKPKNGRNNHNRENDSPVATYGIPDDMFIRGKIPMTKSEVRSISLSKLQLKKDSILYDVGAGTGSVSIEGAMIVKGGMVYAIEKKEDAVTLIEVNKLKFDVQNLEIIKGEASKVLDILPRPTHVFIGGTSGNLKEILTKVFSKNENARIVINVIALESLAEVVYLLKEMPVEDLEITQVTIAKGKEVGNYHLMMGQNPVYVISFVGRNNLGEPNNLDEPKN